MRDRVVLSWFDEIIARRFIADLSDCVNIQILKGPALTSAEHMEAKAGPNPTPASQDMATRIATFDWSQTSLGPMLEWPQSLKTAVRICLTNRFPMTVWWGSELIAIYNDAYVPILAKLHPNALGQSAKKFWAPIWPMLAPQIEGVIRDGRGTWSEDVRVMVERNETPEEGWFTWSFSPLHDDTGVVGGVLLTVVEDTKRVLAERERVRLDQESQVRRGEEHARMILETISDAFFSLGPDWQFTYANAEAGRILGRATSELMGRSIWKEYPGLLGSDFEPIYRNAMDRRVAGQITQFYPDHHRWYEVNTYPSTDGISVFFRNVSQAKQAEEAVVKSKQRLNAVVQTALDCIIGMDHQGHVTEWNPASVRTFGYSRDEAMGQEMATLIVPPALRDRHRQGLANYLLTGEGPVLNKRLELTAVRKDGSEFPVEFSIVRVNVDDPPAFTGYLRDISSRKQAEREREILLESERAARSAAERAGRMKDEFLATLSHELRTPLTAILGWSQVVMRPSAKAEDIAQGLDVIQRNARAQAQIIEDLLDMSRIIGGKVRLDVQRLDLSSIVQASVETARPTADAKGIRLQSVIDPLQGVVVSGDANRLQQVLWNLLSNAIKFTPKAGRVQVLLERVNSHLEISVIDTGEGIDEKFLPYVFDRFSQADGSTTRQHGGLGLGLSIVRQLVELHGGSIRVKSAGRGHGATFILVLPLTVVRPEAVVETERRHPTAAPVQSLLPETCTELKGIRVLVVDDETDARALVKRLLEDCNAVVVSAGSAAEAITVLDNQKFDVLVSDIGMPGEDGYALIKRVRALGNQRSADIPAIALTAYARAEDRVRAISAGFQMHLAKPVEPVELVTMVASAAGLRIRLKGGL